MSRSLLEGISWGENPLVCQALREVFGTSRTHFRAVLKGVLRENEVLRRSESLRNVFISHFSHSLLGAANQLLCIERKLLMSVF